MTTMLTAEGQRITVEERDGAVRLSFAETSRSMYRVVVLPHFAAAALGAALMAHATSPKERARKAKAVRG